MIFHAFLIKYAEIAIKGKNRYMFEDALVKQMNIALSKVEGEFEVKKEQGRIYVFCPEQYDYDETVEALQHVFGIVGICPVVIYEDQGFEQMAKDVVSYMKNCHPNYSGSFKVYTRRAKKSYPITSMEVSAELGGRILDEFPDASVDVHEPDLTLSVEIRDKIYVYSQTIKGAGGMPIGTNGKAMLLLSGGIDSPVAGYMIAKRGVKIDAVYFHAPPYTSERAKQKVVDLAKQVAKYSGPIRLHVVNFTDIQLYIYDQCPHDELTIIMRRYMMRIAEHFAKQGIPFREAHAIVGHMVKACEKKGCDLEDLTDEELQAIDKRVTKELLGDISIKSCVNARVSFGGTAPSEVHRQIEVGRQWLNSLER